MRAAGDLLRRLGLPDRASWVTERRARPATCLLQSLSGRALLFWHMAERLSGRPLLTLLRIFPIVLHIASASVRACLPLNAACALVPGFAVMS